MKNIICVLFEFFVSFNFFCFVYIASSFTLYISLFARFSQLVLGLQPSQMHFFIFSFISLLLNYAWLWVHTFLSGRFYGGLSLAALFQTGWSAAGFTGRQSNVSLRSWRGRSDHFDLKAQLFWSQDLNITKKC